MKILVVGASARAAAQSVRRAGLDAAALDLFIDRDLSEIAECELIEKYPNSIVEQANRWSGHPILLCGGMENFPEVVSVLDKQHLIIGPNASQIHELRNVENWQNWVTKPGNDDWLRFPTTRKTLSRTLNRTVGKLIATDRGTDQNSAIDQSKVMESGNWLRKSYQGAGGLQVTFPLPNDSGDRSDGYWQSFIAGRAIGITFLCIPDDTSILGVMRNLTVREMDPLSIANLERTPFLYAGSMGPIQIDPAIEYRLVHWMNAIAISIGYRGILQADFIVGDDGIFYFLEFNPRWTASMELIEMCSGNNLIQEQLKAQFPQQYTSMSSYFRTHAAQARKQIVYARQPLTISQAGSDAMMERSNWQVAFQNRPKDRDGWADIPAAGTQIELGAPIATAWAIRHDVGNDLLANDIDKSISLVEEVEFLMRDL